MKIAEFGLRIDCRIAHSAQRKGIEHRVSGETGETGGRARRELRRGTRNAEFCSELIANRLNGLNRPNRLNLMRVRKNFGEEKEERIQKARSEAGEFRCQVCCPGLLQEHWEPWP
jgi:hypothetical protein